MECKEVLEKGRVSDDVGILCDDGLERHGSGVKGRENLVDKADELLEGLDLYWEDINDRLTISRMVSESVIKGMVNAVEQEAVEKIAANELEVADLKERLQIREVGRDKIRSFGSPVIQHELENMNKGLYFNFLDAYLEHDRRRESLDSLKKAAKNQVEKLKDEIDGIRGCSLIRRSGSGSELVGLGGILREKESESWVGADRMLKSLNITLDTICTFVGDVLQLSMSSLCDWQQEQEFQGEIEAMVIQSCIRSVQEEFEEKLWDQNAHSFGSQSINWLEKFDELSSLLEELDAILKFLSNPEFGQLTSHGSHDMDNFHRKPSSNHVSSTSLQEGNSKLEVTKSDIPESFDASKLKRLSKDEMINYFNTMMTELRRNHESTVQEMAEKYYSLKREYLNYKDQFSSLSLRKEKEFDILRKKIPKVILRLDDILVESEKLPTSRDNAENLGSLKNRFDSLLLENRQLRDALTDKKREVKCLSSQVSDVADKMLQHSLAEANLLKLIRNLKSDSEDGRMKASISEEVFKCVLRELNNQITCDTEESDMEFTMLQEIYGIIFREAAHDAEATKKCEIEDSDMESLIMQGLCGVILVEFITDAEEKIEELDSKYFTENENRVSLEEKYLQKETELISAVEEHDRLNQEVLRLSLSMEEKDKLAMDVSAAFTRERKQFEIVSQELNTLRDRASQQQTLLIVSNKELHLVKDKLDEAMKQIEIDEIEIKKLNQKIEQAMVELRGADEQKKMLLALTQEKQHDLQWVEAKEKQHKKQVEGLIVLVNGLSTMLTDFECRVVEDIKKNDLRLKDSSSQLSSLRKKANVLRRTGLLYKQRLERRCADLQTAEAEVDLLGNEVDALLSLLEKIFIALEHYSPVLQHYPGIIEILKLVRRELSGEPTKPV